MLSSAAKFSPPPPADERSGSAAGRSVVDVTSLAAASLDGLSLTTLALELTASLSAYTVVG